MYLITKKGENKIEEKKLDKLELLLRKRVLKALEERLLEEEILLKAEQEQRERFERLYALDLDDEEDEFLRML